MTPCRLRRRVLALLPALAVVFVVVGAKFALIVETAVDTPYWDQWDGEGDRLYAPFLEGTLPFARLFEGHNEHRLFLQRVMALALLQINRLWDPLAQMALNAILHAVCAFVLILGATKRLDARRRLLVAVLFAVLFAGAAGCSCATSHWDAVHSRAERPASLVPCPTVAPDLEETFRFLTLSSLAISLLVPYVAGRNGRPEMWRARPWQTARFPLNSTSPCRSAP
jgi:hypothetical protein